MTTVTINDAARATEAGEWCLKNFKDDEWQLYGKSVFSVKNASYNFVFANSQQAMLFMLKWL